MICAADRSPSEVWKKHWMPVMRKIAKKQRRFKLGKDTHQDGDMVPLSVLLYFMFHVSLCTTWDDFPSSQADMQIRS